MNDVNLTVEWHINTVYISRAVEPHRNTTPEYVDLRLGVYDIQNEVLDMNFGALPTTVGGGRCGICR